MQDIVKKNNRIKDKSKHLGGALHDKNFHVEDLYNMGLDPRDQKKNFVE